MSYKQVTIKITSAHGEKVKVGGSWNFIGVGIGGAEGAMAPPTICPVHVIIKLLK